MTADSHSRPIEPPRSSARAAHSPFLRFAARALARTSPRRFAERGSSRRRCARALATTATTVGERLRRERTRLALALGARRPGRRAAARTGDGDRCPISPTRRSDAALAAAIAERTPDAEPRGLRDPRARQARRPRAQLFVRRRPHLALRSRDPAAAAARGAGPGGGALSASGSSSCCRSGPQDGYVFRVDLRLRPSPEVTPIALPVDAAICYYETSALPWERAAFIRARAAAGDIGARPLFPRGDPPVRLAALARFRRDRRDPVDQPRGSATIMRRARRSAPATTSSAAAAASARSSSSPRSTSSSMAAASRSCARRRRSTRWRRWPRPGGSTPDDRRGASATPIALLRTIEHRLQMVDDRQTHSLPADPRRARQCRAAARPRRRRGAARPARAACRARSARIYDALAAERGRAAVRTIPTSLDAELARCGFAEAEAALRADRGLALGQGRARCASPPAREAFEAMLPDADRGVRRRRPIRCARSTGSSDIVDELPSGVNFYRLLEARPALAEHLARS